VTYRDDRARCPRCGLPEVAYCPLWDYRYCENDHKWDGPLNDGTRKVGGPLDLGKPDE
jgi:hypothetical protein